MTVVVILLLGLSMPAKAQHGHGPSWDREFLYRSYIEVGVNPRYLGSDDVGDIRSSIFRFDVTDTNRVHRLALEYKSFDNRVPLAVGLELPEEEFSLGLDHPIGHGGNLVFAGNMNSYNSSDPYWVFGVYPMFSWDSGQETMDEMGKRRNRIAVGMERDGESTTLFNGYARMYYPNFGFLLGASHEKFNSHGGTINRYDRLGGAVLFSSSDGSLHFLFGSTYNLEIDKPSWVGGFSKIANRRSRGINPALLSVGWWKPELEYLMIVGTLWGKGLNDDSSNGLFTAGFRSLFNQSRLVRNRNFNTPVMGRAYDAVDFGLVTATAVRIVVTVMGKEVESWEYALHGTWQGKIGIFIRPYVIAAYVGETDLVFDYRTHQMGNPDQQWYVVSLGTKFHLNNRVDPRHRSRFGFHRTEISLRFNQDDQGVYWKNTFWQ
ncbi:hypothetical protein KKG41_01705 [Patescibacteria group bacterium]|nr:hypothetical protein [Patescibacteria group bacterium]